jgi:hypothetical protein
MDQRGGPELSFGFSQNSFTLRLPDPATESFEENKRRDASKMKIG